MNFTLVWKIEQCWYAVVLEQYLYWTTILLYLDNFNRKMQLVFTFRILVFTTNLNNRSRISDSEILHFKSAKIVQASLFTNSLIYIWKSNSNSNISIWKGKVLWSAQCSRKGLNPANYERLKRENDIVNKGKVFGCGKGQLGFGCELAVS